MEKVLRHVGKHFASKEKHQGAKYFSSKWKILKRFYGQRQTHPYNVQTLQLTGK